MCLDTKVITSPAQLSAIINCMERRKVIVRPVLAGYREKVKR